MTEQISHNEALTALQQEHERVVGENSRLWAELNRVNLERDAIKQRVEAVRKLASRYLAADKHELPAVFRQILAVLAAPDSAAGECPPTCSNECTAKGGTDPCDAQLSAGFKPGQQGACNFCKKSWQLYDDGRGKAALIVDGEVAICGQCALLAASRAIEHHYAQASTNPHSGSDFTSAFTAEELAEIHQQMLSEHCRFCGANDGEYQRLDTMYCRACHRPKRKCNPNTPTNS